MKWWGLRALFSATRNNMWQRRVTLYFWWLGICKWLFIFDSERRYSSERKIRRTMRKIIPVLFAFLLSVPLLGQDKIFHVGVDASADYSLERKPSERRKSLRISRRRLWIRFYREISRCREIPDRISGKENRRAYILQTLSGRFGSWIYLLFLGVS